MPRYPARNDHVSRTRRRHLITQIGSTFIDVIDPRDRYFKEALYSQWLLFTSFSPVKHYACRKCYKFSLTNIHKFVYYRGDSEKYTSFYIQG